MTKMSRGGARKNLPRGQRGKGRVANFLLGGRAIISHEGKKNPLGKMQLGGAHGHPRPPHNSATEDEESIHTQTAIVTHEIYSTQVLLFQLKALKLIFQESILNKQVAQTLPWLYP